jgi:hypothetical protein
MRRRQHARSNAHTDETIYDRETRVHAELEPREDGPTIDGIRLQSARVRTTGGVPCVVRQASDAAQSQPEMRIGPTSSPGCSRTP